MIVADLIKELEREDPAAIVTVWADDKGYHIGSIYAGEPGEVEIQAGEGLEL